MKLRLPIKNNYTLDLSLLFLFIFLFFFSLKEIRLFSITISSNKAIPLFFLGFYYLKKLFILIGQGSIKAIFVLAIVLILVLISLTSIVTLSALIVKFSKRIKLKKRVVLDKINRFFNRLQSTKQIYIILLIFLIAFLPRLMLINDGLFHHDSVQLAIAVEKTVETLKLHPTVGEREGLVLINVLVYSIPYFAFGVKSSEFIITLTTTIFASLAVIMFYLFVKELLNNKFIAITSSLLFAFHPIFFSVSTFAKSHAFSMFFMLLAGYSLVKAFKTDSTGYKILFSLSAGFIIFIRISDLIILPTFLLIYLFSEKILSKESIKLKEKFSFKNLLLFYAPLIFMLILFLIFHPSTITQRMVANKFLQTHDLILTLVVLLVKSNTIPGSFLILHGFFNSVKDKRYLTFVLIVWFISIFAFYSAFMVVTPRFLIPALIPLMVFMGMSLDIIKKRYNILSILVILIVLASMFSFIYPVVSFRHNYSSGKEYVKYTSQLTENISLIIDYGDYQPFYDYYTNRSVSSCPLTDNLDEFKEKMNLIDKAMKSNISVYISQMCFAFGTKQQKTKFINTLKKEYELEVKGRKIIDDFHKTSISLNLQEYKLFKLKTRSNYIEEKK